MKKDVIIIGGGVIGCSIALKLAQEGLKVEVVERGRTGGEASRAAAGMLSAQTEAMGPGPFFDLCFQSRSMYKDFAAEITELSGIDVEYKDEGSLFLIMEGEDERAVDGWTSWQTEAGLALERVSDADALKMEHAVTRSIMGAVHIPDDCQVENRRLMDALDVAARHMGVEIKEGKEVSSIIKDGDRVKGVMIEGERRDAGAVIVAAGCWSSSLLGTAGLSIEVVPARGQMIAVKGATSPIKSVIHTNRCYLVPRCDGRILIGSTTEYVGYRKGITTKGIGSLLTAAIEIVPALRDFEIVETWSGLRPDTSDHLPILGFSGIENFLIATGHFRNGILLAPVTADIVAKTLMRGRLPEGLTPFSIDRFDGSIGQR